MTGRTPIPRSRILWSIVALLSLTAIGLSHWITHPVAEDSEQIDFINRFRGGSLVIAGGGYLPPTVRLRFLDLGGGPKSIRLVVIPSYDATPDQIASLRDTWHNLGVPSVQVLHTKSRDVANQESFTSPLDQATGVWLSGGTQSWLSEQYAGTLVEQKLRAVIDRGGVIGGSSAGAAAMTKVMIEQGVEEAVEGVGFDLLQGAIIDQHFLRRSRLNRLLKLLESHPDRMAFGIDEGTALVVQVPKGRLGVIGDSYVIACIPETDVGGPRFEVLKHRDQIDLVGLKSGRVRVSSPSELDASLED
ncbi:MAG: cyanophycinase [Planctomycetes bacterium]|nr:cyanophycinase [Planctomycetota bacterium]